MIELCATCLSAQDRRILGGPEVEKSLTAQRESRVRMTRLTFSEREEYRDTENSMVHEEHAR